MNQTEHVFMQIKPQGDNRRIQWENDCFNLDDVKMITAPVMMARSLYQFEVHLYGEVKPLVYQYDTKQTALKAQRCIARAYTKTGEFSGTTDNTSVELQPS